MRTLFACLVLIFSFAAPAQAEVTMTDIRPPLALDASARGTWVVEVVNRGTAAVTANVDFSVATEAVATIVQVPAGCRLSWAAGAHCTVTLAPSEKRDLAFAVEFSRPYVAVWASAGTETGTVYAPVTVFAREYNVTNTNDDGPGSLRQALNDINGECTRAEWCGPAFRIDGPVPEQGWFTIRPRSPLPVITAPQVAIDGSTQSRHTGQTNPFGGPEIMLDGSAAGFAHGIVAKLSLRVTDLSVGHFAGNGIELYGGDLLRNYVGVDPSGVRAAPNGWRGVQTMGGSILMHDNVISANGRSGAWLTTTHARVERNLFGVGADGVTPLGNGASGMYVEMPRMPHNNYNDADVAGNVFAYNAHAGISLSLSAEGAFAANTFLGNGGRAIDINIDGPTLAPRPGPAGTGAVIGAPAILSTRYENGVTIVTLIAADPLDRGGGFDRFHVYASASGRDGGELLGYVARSSIRNEPVEFRFAGDLRGQYVSAATVSAHYGLSDRYVYGTSEISEPVLVQ